MTDRSELTAIDDLLALNIRFLAGQSTDVWVDPSAALATLVKLVIPVMIGPGCCIGGGLVIGPAVYLEKGAGRAAGSKL